MNVQWKNGVALITGVQFDARLTLMDSGQSFAWREHEGKFYSVLLGSAACIEQLDDGIAIHPVNEAEVEDCLHYLDLARDYDRLRRKYAMYPPAVEALERLPGLRVLNQPTWETLLTFILSANNNMARIRKLVWLLSEHYGQPSRMGDLTLRSMPAPEVLKEVPEAELRALGFGYRAPFLIQTARMVAEGFPIGHLHELPYEQAHGLLLELSGVGDKVADCVLLFGCGHASAFPVDVWVARLMAAWFPELSGYTSRLKLQRAARELLGEEAGLIQQFMFHCARCKLIPLDAG